MDLDAVVIVVEAVERRQLDLAARPGSKPAMGSHGPMAYGSVPTAGLVRSDEAAVKDTFGCPTA